jgi:hypothetical protein
VQTLFDYLNPLPNALAPHTLPVHGQQGGDPSEIRKNDVLHGVTSSKLLNRLPSIKLATHSFLLGIVRRFDGLS